MRLELGGRPGRRGAVLVEVLVALTVLALVTGVILQCFASVALASGKVRRSFEAAWLLRNVLFDVKSDDDGTRYARTHRAAPAGPFRTPEAYVYLVTASKVAEAKQPWGKKIRYERLDILLLWKENREFLDAQTIRRLAPPPQSGAEG